MGSAQTITLPFELRTLLAGLTTAEVEDSQQWIVLLLRQHGPAVVSFLWRMLGAEQDVLDAYQTAVCQLTAQGRDAIRANPGGYFYRIAMNAAVSILRGRKRQQRQWAALADAQDRSNAECAAAAGGDQVLDQQQVLDRLRQAIFLLPPHLRDVIVLRELAELPYTRVASILGVGMATARLYRRQAVVRLADLIGQEAME